LYWLAFAISLNLLLAFLAAQETGKILFRNLNRNVHWLRKNKIWLWTAIDPFQPRISGWVLGGHRAETFRPLRAIAAT
jgi:hypothetical protein